MRQLALAGTAAQGPILRKRYRKFRDRIVGTYLLTNGSVGQNPAGAQCVNVWNDWRARLGLPWQEGNARDMIAAADPHSLWIENNPRGVPPFGAGVILLGAGVAPEGHVFVAGECDTGGMWGLSQNWPEGSDVHVVRFGYQACAGWRVPILPVVSSVAGVHSGAPVQG